MPDFAWEPKPGFDLAGKRALVVGFTNPVGRAISLAFAEAGADVAVAATSLDGDEVMEAKRVARDIEKAGRKSISQAWDVTLPTNVQVSFKQLVKEFGHPSILAFNADLPLTAPIEKTSDAQFARVLGVNLQGAYYTARTFLRDFPEGETGRLIWVNTIFGERGVDQLSAYATARAGVIGLSAALSQELGGRGITSNCISTGWMDWTPGRGPDEIGQNRLMRFVPMRRFGTAEEVAPLAVLLASDAAGYLNGQVFHVDGGVSEHL
jgi:3-oxoacyl-[acyl-carrier protein] reductase